jgi:hypothetical protein
MRKALIAVAAVVPLTALLAPVALAQQLTDALRASQQGMQFNARALGMGNAYSTVGYDFAALRFNPATMGVSDKFSWSVTVDADAFRSRTDYYGNRLHYTTSNMTGGQLGLTVPFRLDSTRNLVVGLGYTQTKDFNLGYQFEGLNLGSSFPSFVQVLAAQEDPTARVLGLSFPVLDGSGNAIGDRTILEAGMYEKGYLLGTGELRHFTVGAAMEPVHNVFVGASGSYNSGHYTTDLELSASDINDVYPDTVATVPGNAQTTGFVSAYYRAARNREYRGWDARFGVLYNLWSLLGVSASFKVPIPHEIQEESVLGGNSQFATARIVDPGTRLDHSYKFRPPVEMVFGAMAHLWLVTGTAEVTYIDYTSMEITDGAGDLADRTLMNKRIKDDLSRVTNLNVGAEVRLPFTGLRARAGGIYQPSPFHRDPARFAQKVVTLGAGYDMDDAVQVDLGYGYGWRGEYKDPDSGGDSPTEQRIGSHTMLFTVRVAY